MSLNSSIGWTQHTWNPTTGCDKVSAGCRGCYAEVMHRRLMKMHPRKYNKPFLGNVVTHPEDLNFPMTIKKPSVIFVDSMSDLFHKDVPFEFILEVFNVMHKAKRHTFQVLTKRPERAVEFYRWLHTISVPRDSHYTLPLKNVWIGTSVEDQDTADKRIPKLQQIPAVVRFLSCEPLLGSIDIGLATGAGNPVKYIAKHGRSYGNGFTFFKNSQIHWVIAGGESGHNSRPAHPDWFRSLRDQCKAAGVPFFFKQWGEWAPDSHVSFNGPFFIQSTKHYLVNIDGQAYPYGDIWPTNKKKYSEAENKRAEECTLTKENNAWWMANLGKHQSGNELDGVTHTEMPKTEWFKG